MWLVFFFMNPLQTLICIFVLIYILWALLALTSSHLFFVLF